MLVAAAVCPHPPLLVPELAGAAAPELDELRAACAEAVAELRAAEPDVLLIVGGDTTTSSYGEGAAGTLRPWGVDVTVGQGPPVLPLSLTIGRWLLGEDPTGYQTIAGDARRCLAAGRELVAGRRVGLLVMADGSACLTQKAPGYYDPAAQPYNETIVRAMAEADTAALAELDPGKAERLWFGGRPALQLLAGAAGERDYVGRLLYDRAPYGVGYFVAVWR